MTDLMDMLASPEDQLAVKVDSESRNIMELLAITMFADKRVLASEIQTFVISIQSLQNEMVLKSRLSEAEIIRWYETEKKALREIVDHGKFETWMNDKVEALLDFPDKHLLLRAMDDIAMADGEKHISERALEVLTASKWADELLDKYPRKWVT